MRWPWQRDDALRPFKQPPYRQYRINPYGLMIFALALFCLMGGLWVGDRVAKIHGESVPITYTVTHRVTLNEPVTGPTQTVTQVKTLPGIVTTVNQPGTNTTIVRTTTRTLPPSPPTTVTETDTVTSTVTTTVSGP